MIFLSPGDENQGEDEEDEESNPGARAISKVVGGIVSSRGGGITSGGTTPATATAAAPIVHGGGGGGEHPLLVSGDEGDSQHDEEGSQEHNEVHLLQGHHDGWNVAWDPWDDRHAYHHWHQEQRHHRRRSSWGDGGGAPRVLPCHCTTYLNVSPTSTANLRPQQIRVSQFLPGVNLHTRRETNVISVNNKSAQGGNQCHRFTRNRF